MERGLDLTISSVAGESYTVDVSSSVEETCFQWFMMRLVLFFWQGKKKYWKVNAFFVKVDVSAALQGWVGENIQILVDAEKVKPTWKDAHFTIKYRSDALFDFPYWFGFSKRQFKVCFNNSAGLFDGCIVLRVWLEIWFCRSLIMGDEVNTQNVVISTENFSLWNWNPQMRRPWALCNSLKHLKGLFYCK